jgi:hypothetical protein
MTVSNANINYGGKNTAGTDRALYYTRYVQLVRAFLKQTATRGRFMEQNLIDGHKSGRFPVFGRMSGQRHTAGENILTTAGYLQTLSKAEIEIFPDRPLISPDFVDLFDERLNGINFRDAVLEQKTNFLARQEDLLTLFQIADIGLNGSETISGETGAPLTSVTAGVAGDPTATEFQETLLQWQQELDDRHVPETDRYVFLTPTMRRILMEDTSFYQKLLDVDVNAGMANGSFMTGQVRRFAGFELIVTTNMPGNFSSGGVPVDAPTAVPDENYPQSNPGTFAAAQDFSKVRALCSHRTSVGKVIVGSSGIEVEQEYKIEYQGTLHLAKLHTGVKVLRPETCGVLEAQ